MTTKELLIGRINLIADNFNKYIAKMISELEKMDMPLDLKKESFCKWYKGKSGTPDLKECKDCPDSINCLGKKYLERSK